MRVQREREREREREKAAFLFTGDMSPKLEIKMKKFDEKLI
jgi:hypothetical protein